MKKIISVFFVSLMMFTLFGTRAYAEDTALDVTGGVVTSFGYERAIRSFENLTTVYPKEDVTGLYELLTDLEDVLICNVQLPDGKETTAMCDVLWNISEIPINVAGQYEVIGTILLPPGCSFATGVRTRIVLPVQITDSNQPIQIVSIDEWNSHALAVAVPQGGSIEDITTNPLMIDYTTAALSCMDEYGGVHDADIRWDFSSVQLDKPGVYTIMGTPTAPSGTEFSEQLTLPQPTATISVQTVGKPDINCFYQRYPDLHFPWVAPKGKLEEVSVWLCEDGGDWMELSEKEMAWVTKQDIAIATSQFSKGKSYRLQVDYEDGQTGIMSFTWDDTIVINGYWGGDRDGGDSNGGSNTLPPAEVPNKTPEETTDQSKDQSEDQADQPNTSPKQDATQPGTSTLPQEDTDSSTTTSNNQTQTGEEAITQEKNPSEESESVTENPTEQHPIQRDDSQQSQTSKVTKVIQTPILAIAALAFCILTMVGIFLLLKRRNNR